MQTFTGLRFHFLDPRPEEIRAVDIAAGLKREPRFRGQTYREYSVAEHSLRVAELVPYELRAYALLHDASEAYLGDSIKPLKQLAEFSFYREAESRIMRAVWLRFGLPPVLPELVKAADGAMLCHEYKSLFYPHYDDFGHDEALGERFPAQKNLPPTRRPYESADSYLHALRRSLSASAFAGLHLGGLQA